MRRFLLKAARCREDVMAVARGGPRNRSGPAVDPLSGRSEMRGLQFSALPNEGFSGEVPEFPLPDCSGREDAVWAELWRTPQAAAWFVEPWRWRTVALYVRYSVRAEEPEAAVTILAQLHRLADQIGLSPAGLRENGWAIAPNEVGAARADRDSVPERSSSRDRLKRVQ